MKNRRTILLLGCGLAVAIVPAGVWWMASADQTMEAAAVLVRGNPPELIIQANDLPSKFAAAQCEPAGGDTFFNQVFFNPNALLPGGETKDGLVGVIANLTLLPDPEAAALRFQQQGGVNPQSVTQDIRSAHPDAVPLGVEPISSNVEGTDRTLVFRVRYELQGIDLYEYRYRLRVANALSNLIISARATAGGEEPPDLSVKAHAIAERQVARLIAARK